MLVALWFQYEEGRRNKVARDWNFMEQKNLKEHNRTLTRCVLSCLACSGEVQACKWAAADVLYEWPLWRRVHWLWFIRPESIVSCVSFLDANIPDQLVTLPVQKPCCCLRCRQLVQDLAQNGYLVVTWANHHYTQFALSWVQHARSCNITGFIVSQWHQLLVVPAASMQLSYVSTPHLMYACTLSHHVHTRGIFRHCPRVPSLTPIIGIACCAAGGRHG